MHSDEEYEEEFLTITSPKSKHRQITSDEGSPAPSKLKKQSKNSKQSISRSKESNLKAKNSKKKHTQKDDSSEDDTEPRGKKSKKVKNSKVDSSDDEPLVNLGKKSKQKKVESSEEKESEVENGRRRSARVKTLRKQRKKEREKTPEFSELEEEEKVESDFKLTSEGESDDSDDVNFSPKGRNALRQAARSSKHMIIIDLFCKCVIVVNLLKSTFLFPGSYPHGKGHSTK